MSQSRRDFLQSSALLALSAMSGAAAGQSQLSASPNAPLCQVPKMQFGRAEIGRLVLGCNPFNGFSHFNSSYDHSMRDWFTVERVRGDASGGVARDQCIPVQREGTLCAGLGAFSG
jgi:hypothetical protein